MWLLPLLWHFIALRIPLCYLSPIYVLILSYSSIPFLSLISSHLPGSMSCCVSITHRWEAVPWETGSICVTFPRQCKGSICTACFSLQDQQLLILAGGWPGTCDLCPQRLQQSPELSLFPLKAMMWTECQPCSEHLSRMPESSEMGLLEMGSLPVKKRHFSPLPFSLFTAAELFTHSPPYMFLIFTLPTVTTMKPPDEGQSHRIQAKRAAVSCCCELLLQKGQWPEVPLCLMFAKKNKWM